MLVQARVTWSQAASVQDHCSGGSHKGQINISCQLSRILFRPAVLGERLAFSDRGTSILTLTADAGCACCALDCSCWQVCSSTTMPALPEGRQAI